MNPPPRPAPLHTRTATSRAHSPHRSDKDPNTVMPTGRNGTPMTPFDPPPVTNFQLAKTIAGSFPDDPDTAGVYASLALSEAVAANTRALADIREAITVAAWRNLNYGKGETNE